MDVMAPDVVLIADGGGLAPAFPRPIEGTEKVATLLSHYARTVPDAVAATMWLNGAPALRIDRADALDTAVILAIENGRVTRIYAMRNPQKLGRLGEEVGHSRG